MFKCETCHTNKYNLLHPHWCLRLHKASAQEVCGHAPNSVTEEKLIHGFTNLKLNKVCFQTEHGVNSEEDFTAALQVNWLLL